MTNLVPSPSLDDVFQLETTTPVLGGPGGPANSPAQALLNRTAFLDKYTASPFRVGRSYGVNERVLLDSGDIVQSTIPNNTNNPNSDMSGWLVGLPAKLIVDENGKTQQEINNDSADKTYFIVTPEMFGYESGDATTSIQAALDFVSPTEWDTSVAVMNQKGGGKKLILGPKKYPITDTLWVGAYTTIEGQGVLGFNSSSLENVSAIVADFSDPLKPAISSSNWKTGGIRVAYDETTSGAQYDAGLISATHGIKMHGFSVLTKSGTRGYMGVRLQNSPQSVVNVYVNGFDYGVMSNASWDSQINSRCLSYKCGLMVVYDNNNLVFDGYYNSLDGAPIAGSTNLINFFTPDTETDASLNNANTKFGVVNGYSFGASSNSLIAEHNGVGCAVFQGDVNFQTLYTEGNTIAGYVSFTNNSKTQIGNFVGHNDAYACILGANSKTEIVASAKTGTPQGRYFKSLSRYNSLLVVPTYLNEYIRGVKYSNSDDIFFVSSTGNDLNSGKGNLNPLLTIDEALRRALSLQMFSDSTVSTGQTKKIKIAILSNGTFNILNDHIAYSDIDIIALNSANPTVVFAGKISMNDSNILFISCNVTKSNVSGSIENAAFWTRNGSNSVAIQGGTTNIQNGGLVYCDYNGASELTLTLNNVVVTGSATSQLIQSNFDNTSPHIVNVVRSLGSISSEITSRADKGVSVPVAWQNKILGI